METIGNRIKKQRLLLHMNQNELAERTGIDVSLISKYENDKNVLGLDNLVRIAKELKLSLDYLYFGSQSTKIMKIAETKGETIAYCFEYLVSAGVIGTHAEEVHTDSNYSSYYVCNIFGFSDNYNPQLKDLYNELSRFYRNKNDYEKPDQMKAEILRSAAKKLNAI